MTENQISLLVEQDDESQRLDTYIAAAVSDLSRSHVQKLIGEGLVLVNGRTEKANYKIRAADRVQIDMPPLLPPSAEPENIPLDILYEDSDVIVINKPRDLVVHPAAGNETGTLVNALLGSCKDLSGINGVSRPGIVHRLDKDTSGVMMVAKNDKAHIHLANQIQKRIAGRKYIAIVHGNIIEEHGVIDAPIGRHPVDRKKMAVNLANGKPAITHFTVKERFGQYTLVECKLETGRTHQIRVHMSYIGHPVVGDPKYGPKHSRFSIRGQALHSTELTFLQPSTGERLVFSVPIPKDMQMILSALHGQKGR